jgi:predicted transcriptional regulator
MTPDCKCVGENDTTLAAAKQLSDDSIEEALKVMSEHKVRRLPVIDEQRCVGIISQADVATNLPEEKVGDLVEAISAAP